MSVIEAHHSLCQVAAEIAADSRRIKSRVRSISERWEGWENRRRQSQRVGYLAGIGKRREVH